jgi:hypothetical protein
VVLARSDRPDGTQTAQPAPLRLDHGAARVVRVGGPVDGARARDPPLQAFDGPVGVGGIAQPADRLDAGLTGDERQHGGVGRIIGDAEVVGGDPQCHDLGMVRTDPGRVLRLQALDHFHQILLAA